ncbi:MAG: FkbM family methyltransferase [Clostridia bacterium]|nr:FkbM family methyltransferase [Clostridia bacterium]
MIHKVIENLPSVIDSLANEQRPIFLYGMGNGAEKIYSYLQQNGIKIKGVVASDGFVRGQNFLGFDVISISSAQEKYGSLCLVLCFGLEGEKSHFLKELSETHRIISPNLPVFGDGVCDKDFILDNAEKFERVYEILADDESKEIYLNILKYNVTGDMSFLAFGNDVPAPETFFKHKKVHVDIGAYGGDTVLEFVSHNQDYKQIIAFEPDKTTFKKLQSNLSNIRDCVGVNAAVCQKDGKIAFVSGGGRASHIGEGNDTIDCVSVDGYCGFAHIHADGIDVGSIKIDAEGMDNEVIYGAVNTIYCCKPNICVALYHRAEDIIEIPLLLRKHNHKYKFYLRKKEYIPAWDIFLYAINQ